jgi:L-asparaginase II
MKALAVVTRNQYAESVHFGYICVSDTSGNILFNIGDPDTKIFFRSCAKPLQVLPLIRSGAAKALGFSDREIALACASHTGQSIHRDTAEQLLKRLGLDETNLHCGVMDPYDGEENRRLISLGLDPSVLHSACSGKHCAMLALAKFKGCGINDYEKLSSPVQQEILHTIAEFTDEDPGSIVTGTDGCGAPVYLLSLRKIALSYARLIMYSKDAESGWHDACRTVYRSMTENPVLVAGSGEFCTELMQASHGKLIGKVGAEAVYCLGIRDGSLGIAVKIADGNERAVYPVVVKILKDLNILSEEELVRLEHWHRVPLYNQLNESVGAISPCFSISRPGEGAARIGQKFDQFR